MTSDKWSGPRVGLVPHGDPPVFTRTYKGTPDELRASGSLTETEYQAKRSALIEDL